MRPTLLIAILPLVLTAALAAGCGSGDQSTQAKLKAEGEVALKAAAAARQAAEARAPKGSSPTLRAIYASFPPPKPNPEVKGSAAAIRAGERTCAHTSPVAVKERFYAKAAPNLSAEQRKLIARIAHYERISSHDQGFAAGQLAADVYQATLPASVGQFGYEGCVYALARSLEHRIGPR